MGNSKSRVRGSAGAFRSSVGPLKGSAVTDRRCCDWSSGSHAGLASTVPSGCVFGGSASGPSCVSFGLWLGLRQVCVGHALGSPVG
jgi:hypothetical protein